MAAINSIKLSLRDMELYHMIKPIRNYVIAMNGLRGEEETARYAGRKCKSALHSRSV